MYHSYEEFVSFVDDCVPPEKLQLNGKQLQTWTDLLNFQEKGRVEVIKQNISVTHSWIPAKMLGGNLDSKFHIECFLCDKCGIRCSIFDHISCLSIISKVRDKLPSYTVHNQYLMYSCEEILKMREENNVGEPFERFCMDCGIPDQLKTPVCKIIGL